jgi:hypothetical protein
MNHQSTLQLYETTLLSKEEVNPALPGGICLMGQQNLYLGWGSTLMNHQLIPQQYEIHIRK